MNRQFMHHQIETTSLFGALCFLVLLLSINAISNPLQVSELDSALRSEYPEVYPPGSDPGFTRSNVFIKLNGDDPDQIRLTLDSSRKDLYFDASLLDALEGLILPELFQAIKAKQDKNGVSLNSLIEAGLPAQMGRHALLMIPVPEDRKHPNQRPPRARNDVPEVLEKESEALNKKYVPNWTPAQKNTPKVNAPEWKKAETQPAAPAPAPAPEKKIEQEPISQPWPVIPPQQTNPPVTPVAPIASNADTSPKALRIQIDGTPIGETVLVWNQDSSEFEFRSPKLAEAFNQIAPIEERLALTSPDGWFQSQKLTKSNIAASVDKNAGILSIQSPETWKAPITEEPPQIVEVDTTPIDFSKISKNELFSRIFKKAPPPRLQSFIVKLFVEGREMEQVKVIWNGDWSKYTFYSKLLDQYLDTSLTKENRKKVNGIDGNFHSERLLKSGFGVELDESEYYLHITIPPELKQLQTHDMVTPIQDYYEGENLKPATISAYLNMNYYQNFSYSERIFSSDSTKNRFSQNNGLGEPTRIPLTVELDGAIRAYDWVLQNTAQVNEPASGSWNTKALVRKETQLIRDFVPINSRLTIGDINPSLSQANFSGPLLGGARFDYRHGIFPSSQSDDNRIEFQLNNPAKVEVLVNGVLMKTLQLSSGKHIIQGFSGHQGVNNIELLVSYENGFKQTIPFEFIQAAPINLKKDETQGNATIGVQRIETALNPEYKYHTLDNRLTTGIIHHGVTNNVTATIFGGHSQDLQVIGGSILWSPDSTKNWQLTQTLSLSNHMPMGREFSIRFNKRINQVSVGTFFTRTEREFRNVFLSTIDTDPKTKFLLGINLNCPFWKGSASAYANANFNHRDSLYSAIDYVVGSSYSLHAWRSLSINASASMSITDNISNPILSLTTSYFFNSGNHSGYVLNQTQRRKNYVPPEMKIYYSNDTLAEGNLQLNDSVEYIPGSYQNQLMMVTNTGWSYSDGMGLVDGNSYSANIGFESINDYNMRLAYQHSSNFAMLSANYSVTDQSNRNVLARSHYLNTRLSTSLMFADGLFGIGRPVSEGFVLVNGQYDMENTEIRINPSEQHISEYSHSFGPLAATYGELGAYRSDVIKLKLENPPIGAFFETNTYVAQNTYKQGYALRVGLPPTVLIRIRIIDESSQPVNYTTFQVFEMDTKNLVPIAQSFTNKDGVLQAAKLKPGSTYRIVFGDDAFVKDIKIKIPIHARGIYDFGNIQVNHEVIASKLVSHQKKEDL